MRINAILPDDTIKKIDEIAKDEKKSRSNILRKAAEKLIKEHERYKAEQLRKNKLIHAIEIQDRLRKKAGEWNGVAEIRKWREARK